MSKYTIDQRKYKLADGRVLTARAWIRELVEGGYTDLSISKHGNNTHYSIYKAGARGYTFLTKEEGAFIVSLVEFQKRKEESAAKIVARPLPTVNYADGVLTVNCYGELAYQGKPEEQWDIEGYARVTWQEIYPQYNVMGVREALISAGYKVHYWEDRDMSVGIEYGVIAFSFPAVD